MKRNIWKNCTFVDKLGLAGEFNGKVLPYTTKELNKLRKLGWNTKSAQKKGNGHCFKSVGYFQLWINLKYGWFGIVFCPGKVLYGHNAYFISEAEFDMSVELAGELYGHEFAPLLGAGSMDDFPNMVCTRMDIANNVVVEGRPYDDDANLSAIEVIKRQGNGKLKRIEHSAGYTLYNGSHAFVVYLKSVEMKSYAQSGADAITNRFIRMESQFKAPSLRKTSRKKRRANNLHSVYRKLVVSHMKETESYCIGYRLESKKYVLKQILNSFGKAKAEHLATHIELLNAPAFNAKYPNWAKELYEIKTWPSYYNYNKVLRDEGIRPFYSDELAGDHLIPLCNTCKNTLIFKWTLASLWIHSVYLLCALAIIMLRATIFIYTLTCLIKACKTKRPEVAIHAKDTYSRTKILLSCASGVPP